MYLFDTTLSGLRAEDRPTVRVTGRYGREVVNDYWDALWAVNLPEPFLFRRGGKLVTIALDDSGVPQVVAVTPAALRHLVDLTSNTVRVARGKELPAHPNKDDVAVMWDLPDARIPLMRGLSSTPIYVSPGELLSRPGFHERSGLYVYVQPSLVVPEVSAAPTAQEVGEAVRLLTEELLGDFPFTGDGDVANAVAALLTPFVRPLIDGPTPPILIAAPAPATGKSMLAEALMIPAYGRQPEIVPQARSEDEMARKILAALMPAPVAVMVDNVTGTLDSGMLASALTATYWSDRVVGRPDALSVPVRCVWFITGNNPSLSPELARRAVPVWLDRKMEKPWLYTGFRHANLLGWARQNRHVLIWAALTLIQATKVAGWPKSKQVLGSYEQWAGLVGGIVESAGLSGFLENRGQAYEAIATGESEWKLFLAEWHGKHGTDPVDARTLCELAEDTGLLHYVLAGRELMRAVVAMGKEVSNRTDRHFGGYAINRVRRERNGVWLYQAVELTTRD